MNILKNSLMSRENWLIQIIGKGPPVRQKYGGQEGRVQGTRKRWVRLFIRHQRPIGRQSFWFVYVVVIIHGKLTTRQTICPKVSSLIPWPASEEENQMPWKCFTLMERKLRMPQMQGVKGDAVVHYCEPLTTPQMGYYRLSRRVNKMKGFS